MSAQYQRFSRANKNFYTLSTKGDFLNLLFPKEIYKEKVFPSFVVKSLFSLCSAPSRNP